MSSVVATPVRATAPAWLTATVVFVLGALVALLGDACHVTSGTTSYIEHATPRLLCSPVWFPLIVGLGVLGAAAAGRRLRLPVRTRRRREVVPGVSAVLALYALTAVVHTQPTTVSVTICAAAALLVWAVWDPSPATFAVATSAAVVGPLAEIGTVALGVSRYAPGSDALFGVAPWLPFLYFASAAVASGLWSPIAGDGGEAG
jgi:hypothetical protein